MKNSWWHTYSDIKRLIELATTLTKSNLKSQRIFFIKRAKGQLNIRISYLIWKSAIGVLL